MRQEAGMRRFVCALSLAALLGATAGAITYGVPDGDDHPNVGLLIAVIPQGAFAICSGVLVSPTVFLTAGHCTDLLEQLNALTFVSFNSSAPFGPFLPGTPHTHPDFDLILPDTGDIGVVVLDDAVTGIAPAAIASEGFLDDLATRRGLQDTYFTHVGYGTQSIRPRFMGDLVRYQGVSSLVNLTNAWTDGFNLQTTANPGMERSGICFGDSGGPAYYQDSNLVVAVHSFVRNQNCKGVAYSYRVDTATSLDFLAGFDVFPGS
jgi:hypothetical protein